MTAYRPYGYRSGLDEPLPPEARKAWQEWLEKQDASDLLRTLERQSWQCWPINGTYSPRYKLQPDMRDDIRRQLALLVFQAGGSYRDRGCVVRSDGQRIWTELG